MTLCKRKTVLPLWIVLTALLFAGVPGWCQATWEGPTGVFLNPLAFTVGEGTGQASIHFLDLQPVGSLTTVGVTYGIGRDWEVGITRANLSVGGASNINILHTKWIAAPSRGGGPQLAVGAILRDAEHGSSTNDFYLAATQVFGGATPVIASLTVRNTNGLGSGLFGKDDHRTMQFGGFLGVQAAKNLILGVEYYTQPDGPEWKDICFRWSVAPGTFIDGGLAYINDPLDNQFAVALTHQW